MSANQNNCSEYGVEPPSESEEVPMYHPDSKWKEPWTDPHLTLFDLHRAPRQLEENGRTKLPLKVVRSEFQCPICLGYLKHTSIVMECLHRFCRDCIQKSLRVAKKKECPSCRIHIPSRRSLRADPKFDLLINSICGDLEELERQQELEIEILNRKQHMNNASTESRKRGIIAQDMQRKKLAGKSQSDDETFRDESDAPRRSKIPPLPPAEESPIFENLEVSPLIEFLLRRHPQEKKVDRLAREIIKINGEATVSILKTFLSRKLSYSPSSHFQILSMNNDPGIVLDENMQLGEAWKNLFNDGNGEFFVLQYRLFVPPLRSGETHADPKKSSTGCSHE